MHENDPVIDACLILPGLYRISGHPSPISIRDQMLRGYLLIDRLVSYDATRPASVLVVGAGAAGATAALRAAVNYGIKTVLVDDKAAPFELQRDASTRFLNPTQYDWPVDHHIMGVIPWPGGHAPLPLTHPSDFGHNLAMMWERHLMTEANAPGSVLDYERWTQVTLIDPAGPAPGLLVTSTDESGAAQTRSFDTVIWATGAGQEECRVFGPPPPGPPIYFGSRFWSHDTFARPNCGLAYLAKVLIAGSGDGALQDYLRVMTGSNEPIDVLNRCNIPPDIVADLQSEEDRIHRARAWVNDRQPFRTDQDSPYLQAIHNAHLNAAQSALTDLSVTNALAALLTGPLPTVTLAYKENYFTAFYGLNRFLVLLISEYLSRNRVATLSPQSEIRNITPFPLGSHDCVEPDQKGNLIPTKKGNGSRVCHGLDHEVTLSTPAGGLRLMVANVVIIRYGIEQWSNPPIPLTPAAAHAVNRPMFRRILPYHVL